jgi:hypothetical protein
MTDRVARRAQGREPIDTTTHLGDRELERFMRR